MAVPSLSDFPHELICAVARQASSAADMVHSFLDLAGIKSNSQPPVQLSATFLLTLAAALQIHAWEAAGLTVHLRAGLPSAKQALEQALALFSAGGSGADSLGLRVLGVFMDRFAWAGESHLGAPVELELVDDEAALDALAEFLWKHRHDATN